MGKSYVDPETGERYRNEEMSGDDEMSGEILPSDVMFMSAVITLLILGIILLVLSFVRIVLW